MTKIAKNKYPVIRSTTRKMATIEHALEIMVSSTITTNYS